MRVFLSSFVLAAIATVTTISHASDSKILPGTACVPSYPGADFYHIYGATYYSENEHWVSCPLMKDNTGNTGIENLKIFAKQAQFVSGSFCEAWTMGPGGSTLINYASVNIPGFSLSSNEMNFGSALNAGQTDGLFALRCFLKGPAAGGTYGAYINMIRWQEP